MNDISYHTVDMLNETRDMALALQQKLSEVLHCMAEVSHSTEYRAGGLTQADSVDVVTEVNDAMFHAMHAYAAILRANKNGRVLMSKVFRLSHPSVTEPMPDGTRLECNC